MIIEKIVLKYTKPDPEFCSRGKVYVGSYCPEDALSASEFLNLELAKAHSAITSSPTEVKILKIKIEEFDPPNVPSDIIHTSPVS